MDLVGVTYTTHAVLHDEEVVRFGEDDDVRDGHGSTVLKLKLYVVDTAHVKGAGWLPCATAGGEVEHVHVTVGSVGPLHDGHGLTEEQTG